MTAMCLLNIIITNITLSFAYSSKAASSISHSYNKHILGAAQML